MANYANLKSAIQQVIKTNGNNEITGALLQQTLFAMVNSLGAGYQYAGVATPDTNPGTPDQNVFYLASTAGTYANFGSQTLLDGQVAILKYNGSWSKDVTGIATSAQIVPLIKNVKSLMADYEDILEMELGAVGAGDGSDAIVANRARTPYISAPFSAELKTGYRFNFAMRYTMGANGSLSYVGYDSISGTQYSASDSSYVYRLVISKTNGSISSSDVNDCVLSYSGAGNSLYAAMARLGVRIDADERDLELFKEKFVNFPEIPGGQDYYWQQGGILSGGTEPSQGQQFYSNRVKSGNYFRAEGSQIQCIMNTSGFGYRIMLYNSSKVWQSQDLNDDGSPRILTIPSGYYIRFVLLKTSNADITPEEANNVDFVVGGLTADHQKTIFESPVFSNKFDAFRRGLLPDYDWLQGAINGDGGESGVNNRVKTGTYFLSHGETINITIKSGYQFRIFYYNSRKTFIDWTHETYSVNQAFSTTSGYYYRFVVLKGDGTAITPDEVKNDVFVLDGFQLDETDGKEGYIRPAYKEDVSMVRNNLQGKVVAFIGDSITQQSAASDQDHTYHGVFATLYKCQHRNLGVNATCIANNTKNGLGSTRFVTRATPANLSDAALVVVFGGTNDFAYDSKPIGNLFEETTITPSGNIGDKQLTAPTDQDTFAGALHNLIQTIQANVTPGTPIVFVTPLHRNNNAASNPNYTQCNENGDFMVDFVNAIKTICGFYAIPVLDLYSNSQLNPLSPDWSYIFGDGLHPNNIGHRIIGELLYRFVEQNIVIV